MENNIKPKKVDKKFKELVVKYAREHAYNIGASHYKMDVTYMAEDKQDGMGQVAAEMCTHRRYLDCELIIFPLLERLYKEQGESIVSRVIAHEISHIATQHMRDLTHSAYKTEEEVKDAWETLTEIIGRMAVKIHELETKKK